MSVVFDLYDLPGYRNDRPYKEGRDSCISDLSSMRGEGCLLHAR